MGDIDRRYEANYEALVFASACNGTMTCDRQVARNDLDLHTADGTAERLELLRRTTEYADFASAEAHSDALDLELRGPNGAVIPTEWIGIQDTQFLLSIAMAGECDGACSLADLREYHPQSESAIENAIEADLALLDELREVPDNESDSDSSAECEFPRYQVQVQLLDDRAIPVFERPVRT